MRPPIPAEIDDRQLGEQIAEFYASTWARLGRALAGVICTLLGIACSIGGIYLLVDGHVRALKLLLFGVVVFCAGPALLWSLRETGRKRVVVFTDGLVMTDGEAAESCRWEEIEVVWQKFVARGEQEDFWQALNGEAKAYHLNLTSGRVLILKSYFCPFAKLGKVIKETTLLHLLPAYRNTLETTGVASFGPLALTRDGIVCNEKTLPWHELERLDRKQGWIKILKKGAWLSWEKVKLADVPNAHVFSELVSEFTQRLSTS